MGIISLFTKKVLQTLLDQNEGSKELHTLRIETLEKWVENCIFVNLVNHLGIIAILIMKK